MFKRFVAVITSFVFIFTLFPLTSLHKAYAYQNSSYFRDLRVGLVSMSSQNVTITLNGDYTVNGQAYKAGSVLNLSVAGTSISLNGAMYNQIDLIPLLKDSILTVTTGTVSTKYLGAFLIKVYNGKILPVNMVDIETYLKGVVGFELSDNNPMEALKAQTIAARNYALSRIGWESAKGYDFDDTHNYQVYKGYNPQHKNIIIAVEQTKGQVLLYNEKLVETLYSAWHGGVSEDSENVWGNTALYLRSVQDSFENRPWPNGDLVFSNAKIQEALVAKKYLAPTDLFQKLDLNSITRYKSGRVASINIFYKDSAGNSLTKTVTRDNTRSFLTLPSNLYTVTYSEATGSYTFSGRGNGHGLGMSQIGAVNRAAAGQSYEQILKFYYQNVYIQSLLFNALIEAYEVNKNEYLTGQTISLNTKASSGSGSYLYKYIVSKDGSELYATDYLNSSSLLYKVESAGNYAIAVYVKDALSTKPYDDTRTLNVSVYNQPAMTLTGSHSSVLTGDPVKYSISGTNGSGKAQYKFTVIKDSTIISDNGYSDTDTFTFTPSSAGNYTVKGYIKDVLSENEFDAENTLNLDVYNPQLGAIYAWGYMYEGQPVTFKAVTSGASSQVFNYKYEVFNNGIMLFSNNFNALSTFSFTPSAPGSYLIKVYGKDALSTKDYDTMKQFNVIVNKKPLYLSTLPLKYGMTNSSVTSLQNALISLGYNVSSATGYFGTQTQSAVMAYQTKKGLKADGIVGSVTYNALNEDLIKKTGIKSLTY